MEDNKVLNNEIHRGILSGFLISNLLLFIIVLLITGNIILALINFMVIMVAGMIAQIVLIWMEKEQEKKEEFN